MRLETSVQRQVNSDMETIYRWVVYDSDRRFSPPLCEGAESDPGAAEHAARLAIEDLQLPQIDWGRVTAGLKGADLGRRAAQVILSAAKTALAGTKKKGCACKGGHGFCHCKKTAPVKKSGSCRLKNGRYDCDQPDFHQVELRFKGQAPFLCWGVSKEAAMREAKRVIDARQECCTVGDSSCCTELEFAEYFLPWTKGTTPR
jgi:hypothetical protein